MSITDKVNQELRASMRARNKPRTMALRNIRAAIIVATKAGGEAPSDSDVMKLIRGIAKKHLESLDLYAKGGRDDLVAEERAQLDVVEEFLPQLADEATTRQWVSAAIEASGATSMRELGKVMGALMRDHKGLVDGKLAQVVARELLD
jgi:uncharacterized protein YqeY